MELVVVQHLLKRFVICGVFVSEALLALLPAKVNKHIGAIGMFRPAGPGFHKFPDELPIVARTYVILCYYILTLRSTFRLVVLL